MSGVAMRELPAGRGPESDPPPALRELVDLSLLPLQVTLRARGPLRLPEHWTSSLRGAFGAALKNLACVRRELPACPGCPHFSTCAYPALFEPRAPAGATGFAGFRDPPRPYVFRAPAGARQLRPHELLTWHAVLIGAAAGTLPYFVLAWRSIGEHGLGHGRERFDLLRVERTDARGLPLETLYSLDDNCLRAPTALLTGTEFPEEPEGEAAAEGSLTLRFLSPTALARGGQPVRRPEFPAVWHAVQLRLSTLRLAHGAGRPAIDYRATLRAAEAVRLVHWEAAERSWHRYSQAQRQRVPMRGFVGEARYAGPVAPFLPALRLGSLVGVGDNCAFGQGAYEVAA
jgi:hypothetical protein